jgi:hypothetical protein
MYIEPLVYDQLGGWGWVRGCPTPRHIINRGANETSDFNQTVSARATSSLKDPNIDKYISHL